MAPPLLAEVRRLLLDHLIEHHSLYGEYTGVRSARKHLAWYVRGWPQAEAFKERINAIEDTQLQIQALQEYLNEMETMGDRVPDLQGQTAQAMITT